MKWYLFSEGYLFTGFYGIIGNAEAFPILCVSDFCEW